MGDRPRPPYLRLSSHRLPDARLLASVLESLPDAVAVLGRDRGIVHHNFRFAEIWGLPLEAVRSASGDEIRERGYERLEEPSAFREGLERLGSEPEQVHVDTARLLDGRLLRRELRPRYGKEGLEGWVAVYRDVTDEEASRTELLRSIERYRVLFESDVVGVFRVSADGELIECNRALAGILGYPDRAEVEGRSVGELLVDPRAKEGLERALEERGTVTNVEIAVRRRDGQVSWMLANATLAPEDSPDRAAIVGTAVDVSRRRALESELEHLTRHDRVTGLPNRRALEERVGQARARADRSGSQFAVVRLDLAGFGPIAGDGENERGRRLLVELGRRVRGGLRDTDFAARLGEDAFAVLLGEVDGIEGARRAASRLAEALTRPLRIEGRDRDVGVRAAVAVYPVHGATLDELLEAARTAAEEGSEEHGAIAVPSAAGSGGALLTAERLEGALRENELVLHYQPVFDLTDRSLVGAEALVRWEHPEQGVLPAAAFLPLAQRSGLVTEIDRRVLRSALRQTGAWIGGRTPQWIGVKVSRRTAFEPDLATELEATADAVGGSLERVVLELHLPDLARDPEGAVEAIGRLRSVGCRVALRGLRIDRWTAAQLEHPSPEIRSADMLLLQGESGLLNPRLTSDIVRHGHELGLVVVAVGIESEEGVTWIGSSGADLALGYALGRPVPPEAFPDDGA